jgi:excisionase family DNA binding protein
VEEFYTPQEIAAILKVPRKTVYTWLQKGKLQGVKAGDLWRIPKEALDAFLKKPSVGGASNVPQKK